MLLKNDGVLQASYLETPILLPLFILPEKLAADKSNFMRILANFGGYLVRSMQSKQC